MNKPQKILTIALWIVAVGSMVGIVAMKTLPPGNSASTPATQPDASVAQVMNDAMVAGDPQLPILYPAPVFTLTDQDAKPFNSSHLLGHPWVADFFFTTCGTLCPIMSAHMEQLQKTLPGDVQFVSFSVDPLHDTPAAMKTYSQQFHAQEGRWYFLTGDQKVMDGVIQALKVGVLPAQGDQPIQHDEHFVLIDALGNIRGYYDSLVPTRMTDLIRDANTLAASSSASEDHRATGAAQ
jgi:protein SCO1/2